MALLGQRIAVSIPDTVLEEKESLRDKTAKLGQIARACAIYGVDVIEVFGDRGGRSEGQLIVKVLEFLDTPQYLRRRLFPLDEILRYAGALPPLRIPSHKAKVPTDKVGVGDFREGVTNGDGSVDVGLDEAPTVNEKVSANKRVTIRILSTRPLRAEVVPRERVGDYWGFRVRTRSAEEVFTDPEFVVKVATSRLGRAINEELPRVRVSVRNGSSVKLVFGSPSRGLFDIVGKELLGKADFVLNLFPDQHVETVRTEEAIFAGLNLLSLAISEKA